MAIRTLACLTLVFLLSTPAIAQAEDYGTWFAEDQAQQQVYSEEIEAFNSRDVSEQASFVCVMPNGQSLSTASRTVLSSIVLAASDVYAGTLQVAPSSSDITAAESAPENGGYRTGTSGMRAFLRNEALLLRTGRWVPYESRELVRIEGKPTPELYLTQVPGWAIELSDDAVPVAASEGRRLVTLLNFRADHPLELTANIPEACALDPLEPDDLDFGALFASPGDFIRDALIYVPASVSATAYEFLQPYAFRYAFWTPHTERGDLMWGVPLTCSPRGAENRAFSRSEIRDACQGREPLGFQESAARGNFSSDGSWFLAAAGFLQWLISGTYFLILFAAAILYMYRGNRATSLNLVQLIPRLFLSICLTLIAGYVIGSLITSSNLLVKTIFEFDGAADVGAVNTFLLQAGNIAGGSDLLQSLVALTVGALTVLFFAVFVIASLARQLLLVALVVLAPLACFCLLAERWRGRFNLWLRLLLVVCFLPVALSLIFKIGMSINPLIVHPEAAYGNLEGIIGLILMLVTLWMMTKLIRLARDYAIYGGRALSPAALRVAMAGSVPSGLLPSPPPEPSPGGSAGAEERPKLVPPSKETGAGSGALARLGIGKRPAGLPEGSSGPESDSDAPKGLPAGDSVKEFQARKRARTRVSERQARSYRKGLQGRIREEEKQIGRKLEGSEVEKIKRTWAKEHGGRLKEDGGSFYLEGEAKDNAS